MISAWLQEREQDVDFEMKSPEELNEILRMDFNSIDRFKRVDVVSAGITAVPTNLMQKRGHPKDS